MRWKFSSFSSFSKIELAKRPEAKPKQIKVSVGKAVEGKGKAA